MLKKLVEKRNLIALVMSVVTLAFLLIYLLFGSSEEKIKFLVLTVILVPLIYGFMRLAFKLISLNATIEILKVFMWFFLIFGALGFLMLIISSITNLPNGFNPSMGGLVGMIASLLDIAKKYV